MLSEYSAFINLFTVFYVLLVLSSMYIKGIVFLEWVISFLHYIIPFNIIVCILFFFTPQLSPSVFLLGLCTIPLLIRFLNFTVVKPVAGAGNKKITIAFFNKLYSNRNYEEIDEKIKEIKPDIIGMVELQDGEIEKIPTLSEYKHCFYNPSRPNAALGLLSKYPFATKNLDSLPHAIVSTTSIDETLYQVIVFHPNPPIYGKHIKLRDSHLKNLKDYIDAQTENTILMGDFNVTPWSPSYISYLSKLELKNTAQGSGIHNTLHKGPLKVFIDFIFIPKKSGVESFKTHYMKGSDHKLIETIIKI